MTWIIYALVAQIFMSSAAFIDKHMAENRIRDTRSLAVLISIAHIIPIMCFIPWTGFPVFELFHLFLAILTGLLMTTISFPYYWITQRYPVSQNELFIRLDFVVLFVVGYLFFHETLSFYDILGAFMILIGVLIFKRSRVDRILGNQQTNLLYFLLISSIIALIVANAVIVKYLVGFYSEVNILFYYMIGAFISGMLLFLLFPTIRTTSIEDMKEEPVIKAFWFSLLMFIVMAGRLLRFKAYALGPIALVQVIGNFKVLITIIFGGLLSLISHQTFREDTSRIGMTYKIIGALIMILGLTIIAN